MMYNNRRHTYRAAGKKMRQCCIMAPAYGCSVCVSVVYRWRVGGGIVQCELLRDERWAPRGVAVAGPRALHGAAVAGPRARMERLSLDSRKRLRHMHPTPLHAK
eukprot:366384-Chlamydomonas_euryale.AAC.15